MFKNHVIRLGKLPLVAETKVKELSVTEVCSGEELPEVEIISLLEEQIPRYRLRADTLTQFQGEQTNIFICVFFFKTRQQDSIINYLSRSRLRKRGLVHPVSQSLTRRRFKTIAGPDPRDT